jgi:hypothetical protein
VSRIAEGLEFDADRIELIEQTLLQGKRWDLFLPEPSAFFLSAERREGRDSECSLFG